MVWDNEAVGAVHRRKGGLESKSKHGVHALRVHRRKGGLEMQCLCSSGPVQVHRRKGGLEITVRDTGQY